ncbi:MAG: NUDIX domain-containing protein [Chloroflexota bacterium]
MVSLGVNVAVIDSGRILLTQREDFEVWCLPGGETQSGESLAQAARREVREETGLEVDLTRLVGVYSRSAGAAGFGGHVALFAARPTGGSLQGQPEEVVDLRFFAPDEVPAEMIAWHRRRIADALDGVGGGVARWLQKTWPFQPGLTKQGLYALRDASGLTRREFYLRYMHAPEEANVLEVPRDDGAEQFTPGEPGESQPRLAASVVVMQDGKLVLARHEDFDVWCLPGGGVEAGETLAQAARREVEEETGLQVKLTRLVGIYSEPQVFLRGIHIVQFAGYASGGTLRARPGETAEVGYFASDELPEHVQFGNRLRILDALSGAGGGVAWMQRFGWPFAPEMTRKEIYALRDRSGLRRAEFYHQYFDSQAGDEYLEVGPGST